MLLNLIDASEGRPEGALCSLIPLARSLSLIFDAGMTLAVGHGAQGVESVSLVRWKEFRSWDA